MKPTFERFIAAILIAIPGVAATYGFLLMKDAIFDWIGQPHEGSGLHLLWPFLGGFLLFAIGVGFIAGWIFFRDRKRNYVATRFKPKRKRPER